MLSLFLARGGHQSFLPKRIARREEEERKAGRGALGGRGDWEKGLQGGTGRERGSGTWEGPHSHRGGGGETTGQATKFGPTLREMGSTKRKPPAGGRNTSVRPSLSPPGEGSARGSPRRAPLPRRPRPTPGTRPGSRSRPSDPGPAPPTPARPPAPAPALRDVLVEVGEEQLVSASLAALTGQVHGGRAAGGWSRPEARARGGGRVHSGSAPGPARRRSRRCSLPRDQSPPHPSPLLFMLRSRGALRACAVRPFGARASHGAGVLRRSRPFTSGPG